MKIIIPYLIIILFLIACQQSDVAVTPTLTPTPNSISTTTPTFTPTVTAVPTSELIPYYGTPQPAKVIINGETYESEIGTTSWVYIDADGNRFMKVGDAFAIITPAQPIVVKSPFSLTLKLPIPINPTDLWYRLIAVTAKDRAHEPSDPHGLASWNPSLYPEQIFPPLLDQQEVMFSSSPGTYVLEIYAGWIGPYLRTELEANYGFLFEVQE